MSLITLPSGFRIYNLRSRSGPIEATSPPSQAAHRSDDETIVVWQRAHSDAEEPRHSYSEVAASSPTLRAADATPAIPPARNPGLT
jgi:hypothetical protein